MEIKVRQLKLRNFKGIKSFTLDLDGDNATIYGRNGVGKSTLADALSWLLFDKDASGNSKFSVKRLDNTGLEIHNLEHEVEAVLIVDGSGQSIKKTLTEKWTKKRGSSTPEFSGHVTSYEVNGVPKKKGEYTSFVDHLVREDLFRLLTSTTHFNAMKWQDRRQLLLEVSGSLTDKEVLDRIGLDRAKELLDGRSYEDAVAVLKSQRSKVSKALDGIQPRLDEVDRSSSTDAPESPKTNLSLAELQEALKAAQNERAAARRVELEAEQQRLGQELDGIDADLMTLEDFLRAKVGMIEGLVADKFAPLGFKLFEDQINGGLRETCETLVPSPEGNLVPWQDANTGHRILAGLRIT